MAVVTAVRGALNMDDLGFDRDGSYAASQSNIRLSYDAGGYTDFGGSYQPTPSGGISGTVRSITNVDAAGRTTFTVTDGNADAETLFGYIRAGDVRGAEAYFLRDDDTITGAGKADKLYGFGGDDTIVGGGGRDVLVGGEGQDTLTGGTGPDRFVYLSDEDSGRNQADRDKITDFSHAEGDRIDLSAIDAIEGTAKNDKFTLVDQFSGAAGEVMVKHVNGGFLVIGETDGNNGTDFTVLVKTGGVALVEADFIF